MSEELIRIGIVGAGRNTREKHIPGLRAQANVELAGVVNRTAESGERVCREFGIPRRYGHWQELIDDPQIEAVVIGTWPNLHCEVTCAALAAGKHVLTEARMARDVEEARRMLAAAEAHPELVAQVVPSPCGLVHDAFVREMLDHNYLGDLRELVVIGANEQFHDYTQPLHWRQDAAISGDNVLALGILHETALRWTPPPTRVFAQSQLFEPTRPAPHGPGNGEVTVPDSLQALTHLAGGARGLYHFSGVALFGPGLQLHLYGSLGTIKARFGAEEQIWIGRAGDRELQELKLPPEKRGGWRVEEEFIGAVRGTEKVTRTDFATGVRYMEFVSAVAESLRSQQAVDLSG